MDFWDEKAAPAILAAVRAACETVKGDLTSEIQERDRSRHIFLTEEVSRLKDIAAKAEQLEKENQRLQRELEELRKAQRPPRSMSNATTAVSSDILEDIATGNHSRPGFGANREVLGELSPNRPAGKAGPDWEKDYMNLAKRYAALEAKFEAKQLAGRKVRDERNAWVKYAEKLEARLKRDKRRRNQSPTNGPASSTVAKPTAPLAAETGEPAFNASFISNPESNSGSGQHDDAVQKSKRSRRAASTPGIVTQRNDHAPVQNNIETNNDETGDEADPPELPTLPQPHVPEPHILIKQEPRSDDVVVVSERELRKRKIEGDRVGMEPPARRIKSEYTASSDPVVTAEVTTFLPQESMDFDAGPEAFPTPKRQRFLGVEAYLDHGRAGQGEEGGAAVPTEGERASEGGQLRKITGTADRLSQESADLPGDAIDFQRSRPARKTVEVGYTALARQKLESLGPKAGEDTAEHESAAAQPAPQPQDDDPDSFDLDLVALRALRERQARQNPLVKTPAEPNPLPKPRNSAPTPRFPKNQNQNQPKTGKLRQRPVSELRMEDFKINPKFNNGHTHAYDEVVRDKASRAELPGCVDPNCCGKQFRAMAQSELDNGGLGILSRKDDVELLEKYLGDEAYRLIGMPLAEKRKLWLDAKTRDLANKYGRHRHRFVRRPSPPGYWNPDFPSTQEVQANKEEARKIERGMIEERWREAMRGGSRWLFRDE
ncbi:DNA repair protein endonuclease SAE2/CtIP C-terminus-domain-containing protein [Podospora aff. communis PSN243]|uniref:DNA repair protein endonuclease SAE2/CtIP C-terminus-domain-containing protein n=1 Tax=Podospora aff. communis PSN243 TaxID=3040156 RepID=A0AAV9GKN3_9PEZI|nr:DNA repair protein endonuclease SAE2/CtIP C-terminus-domain-containing protein [Podospora aff. communis PSN243]